jgi:acylphosphatase
LTRKTVHFSGHVQGVGFRFMVLQSAHRFPGVTGFVRNLPDGRVQLVIEGGNDMTADLVGYINERMAGYIDHCDESQSPATGEFRVFEIRR